VSGAAVKSLDFLWPAGRSGVLLIHGLTGTPTEMRFVARGLHEAGFTVRAVQLAGHCGGADDLVATGWRDWSRSVDVAATELRAQVDHLFVAGLSMGALLALKLAIDRPDEVDGVGLYGTTFRYDGWAIPKIARLSFLLPLACRMGFGRERVSMEIEAKVSAPIEKVLLDDSYHMVTVDQQRDVLIARSVRFFERLAVGQVAVREEAHPEISHT